MRRLSMSESMRYYVCAIHLFLIASVLSLSIVTLWVVPLYIVLSISIILISNPIDSKSRYNMTIWWGAIVGALSPAVVVAWGFRIRSNLGKQLEIDGLSFVLAAEVLFQCIAIGALVMLATGTVIDAVRSRKELTGLDSSGKSFRQKVRDGDIQSNVDRPIRRSVKR